MKILAIFIAKIILFVTRITHLGGGTTLPGLVATKIDKNVIKKISERLKYGVVIITGTNGKTTTAKILTEILTEEGFSVLTNPSGSNLARGIASSLVGAATLLGSVEADIAVFEVDEATMSEVTTQLRPKIVLVTNLFRDQLDRYGELDKTAAIIGKSLTGFSEMTTILNADDPLVSSLSDYVEGRIIYYGLEDTEISTDSTAAMDSKDCMFCGHELEYESRYLGHLGRWKCPNCRRIRTKPHIWVSEISLEPLKSSYSLKLRREELKIEMPLPGLYNIYNALAAATIATLIGVGAPAISHALRNCEAAFGRMELIEVSGKKIMMLLVKNPTGANQALAAIFSDNKAKKIGFYLNDNFADGTDISWIWDVDFEYFDLAKTKFVASGNRAEDIALRLKYAQVDKNYLHSEKDIMIATEKLAELLDEGEIGYLLPTYTAMVEVRSHFASKDDQLCDMGKVTKHGI